MGEGTWTGSPHGSLGPTMEGSFFAMGEEGGGGYLREEISTLFLKVFVFFWGLFDIVFLHFFFPLLFIFQINLNGSSRTFPLPFP